MRLAVLLILPLLLAPATVRAQARLVEDPLGDERTDVGVASASACHAPSVDVKSFEVSSNATHATLVATMAGTTGVLEASCPFGDLRPDRTFYSLVLGDLERQDFRLSVLMLASGPGTGPRAGTGCVQLATSFLVDGVPKGHLADGCFGEAFLEGDRAVLVAPLAGTATFRTASGPVTSAFSVPAESPAEASTLATHPLLDVRDSVRA